MTHAKFHETIHYKVVMVTTEVSWVKELRRLNLIHVPRSNSDLDRWMRDR
jgi:hypothetical protein